MTGPTRAALGLTWDCGRLIRSNESTLYVRDSQQFLPVTPPSYPVSPNHQDTMAPAKAVLTSKAPAPIPQLSQAVVYNGMVYCSGSLGIDPATGKMVEGTVKDRTV